ncbi:hypothetical protein OKJ48_29055 [Streptomyces kunmingensis]|uniref:DUF11 domain-containing protein n=1 Tax=Streptomyces kunmingensis TaxID=68225 RepID=A0ABU6CJU6_9ACTN|nr:hypothetical protein [Streptomyces kunmingensis]MEB3964261.1 hypothetical protein [Streptomyces kunmingensis]
MRLSARAAVAAVVIGLVGLGPAGVPAFADEPEIDQLWMNAPSDLVLPAASAQSPGDLREVSIGLYHHDTDFEVTDGRVSVDVSGIASFAQVDWPANCTPSGTTAVCSVPVVDGSADPDDVHLTVRAAAGSEAGAQGTVRYSATATGGPDGTLTAFDQETAVTVASGPDLALSGVNKVEHAVPGSTLTQPLTVTNKGTEAAHGFTLEMTAPYGLDFVARPAECEYRTPEGEEYAPMTFATCVFDRTLEPGESFALPGGVRLAVREHALYERLDVSVTVGGGATDIDTGNDYAQADITADNTADFRARGATIRAGAGRTVTASLRFRNAGPAWVANLGSGDPVAEVALVVPRGSTVTAYPEECHPTTLDGGYFEGTTGAPRYACSTPMWVAPDAVRDFAFSLHVDKVVRNATGAVTVRPAYGDSFPFDPRPGNNTAKVVLNPAK